MKPPLFICINYSTTNRERKEIIITIKKPNKKRKIREEAKQVWISKKRWEAMEKRIADLEREVQGQQKKLASLDDHIVEIVQSAQIEQYNRLGKAPLPM